ncbi:hypothetical protein Glove_9g33 [Diversispora epigaea]|uniref:Uncharacterized protein n=1 Tax=Diversispora epigaea TaxID=1348612 RepID=A0A397JZC3_9GLOM|nr:hypothetical protein Glove_9g33 [Diversispora epigaea]
MNVNLKNNPIWYQFENRAANAVRKLSDRELHDFCEEIRSKERLEIAASTLTLKVKHPADEYSIILDDNYFENNCNNDFRILINMFNISQTNPVKVTPITSENQEIQKLREEIAALKLTQEIQKLRKELAALKSTQETIHSPMVAGSSTSSAHAPSNEIRFRYKDKYVSFKQIVLDELENVGELKLLVKAKLKIKGDIIIRRGNDTLEDSDLVTELYNVGDEIMVTENDDGNVKRMCASNIEPNRIEEAFRVEYKGKVLETFYQRLKFFHDEWHKQEKSYAPYLAIIQSSGYGKTRLIGELKTNRIYVLYICKRHENSNGYPASTPLVDRIFETIRDHKFGALLSSAIRVIKTRKWNEKEFWDIQIKAEHKDDCNRFWKTVFEKLSTQNEPSPDCSNKNFVKELFPDREICVVCCIDEAHELLTKTSKDEETYFVQWRRQIRGIYWHGFFNILLSTNGRIGNFLPPVIKDTQSARDHDFEVFPTYLDVHTMDVLASLSEGGRNYDLKRTVYLGIPLWGSLAQAGVELADILHLASQKIRNFSKKKEKDRLANLACMSCSLALEISPQIAEVDMLVASHMATAIGVSFDRTSILCTYPSDSILASGALKGIIEVGWEDCLDTLLEYFSRGTVEAGERGELVNRILFLKTYADIVKGIFTPVTYLEKVPLRLFLMSLAHNEINGLDDHLKDMGIHEAEIGFNHWTALLATNQDYVKLGGNKFLSEDLIIEAYHRHAAFKMPIGFYDIDHIIPFKHSSGYGIVSIQNKNAKKRTFNNTTDITSLVNPGSALGKDNTIDGFKVIGIYIDLGLDDASTGAEIKGKGVIKFRNHADKSKKQIIYIQNIESFKCCEAEEICKRLHKVLFTRPWPLDIQWSMFNEDQDLGRANVIKSFLPLVFYQGQSLVEEWQLNNLVK